MSEPMRETVIIGGKEIPFSVNDMFRIGMKYDSNWGIEGYEVAKKYLDPKKIVEIREQEKNGLKMKGKKDKRYVTKRGCYLDFTMKAFKTNPAPNAYKTAETWGITKQQKDSTRIRQEKDRKRDKNSYVDQIFKYAKLNKYPGPGQYVVRKAEKDVQKDIEKMHQHSKLVDKAIGDRPNFLQGVQALSDQLPGPGNYNPRGAYRMSVKNNRTDDKPDKWIEKHKAQYKKSLKSNFPDVGTYKPESCTFTTFNKLLAVTENNKKEKKPSSTKMFGTEIRFEDFSKKGKQKSKSISGVPGPGQYDMISHWQGKPENGKKDKGVKKPNWNKNISHGPQISLYYENK